MTATVPRPDTAPPHASSPGSPPRRSGAWVLAGSVLAAVLLVATTYRFVEVLAHEEHDRTWVVTEPVTTLDIHHSGDGSVHVIGAPVDVVTIDARVSDGLRATAYDHRVVGDVLEVTASCPNFGSTWCRVDYVVEVPHGTVVRMRADGGARVESVTADVEVRSEGSIDVSGLTGAVLLASENGSVRAVGLRSEVVDARSSNGSVRVSTDVAPRSVVARSDNGSVEVLVPRTADRYAVDVDSRNGRTTNEVGTDPLAERRLTARSDNGSVRVAYNEA